MWLINGMREEFSIRLLPVSIRNVTRWMLCIRLLQRIRLIRQDRTATTVGRNYSVNVCIWLTIVIRGWMYVLPVSIIFSVRKEPGRADVRSRRPLFAVRWLKRLMAERLRCGGTETRPVRFFISMNAWKVCAA